jgi:hypothetical protein
MKKKKRREVKNSMLAMLYRGSRVRQLARLGVRSVSHFSLLKERFPKRR